MRTVYTDGADVVGTATAASFMPDSGRPRGSSSVQSKAEQCSAVTDREEDPKRAGRTRQRREQGCARTSMPCIVECLRAWSI
jgi:hypothetical protein